MMYAAILVVLYLVMNSGFAKKPSTGYRNNYRKQYYKSNANMDTRARSMGYSTNANRDFNAAPVSRMNTMSAPVSSGYSSNANRDFNAAPVSGMNTMSAPGQTSGYKTNAFSNRPAMARKVTGMDSTGNKLGNIHGAVGSAQNKAYLATMPKPAVQTYMSKVGPAGNKSPYGYGMAPVKF